MMTPSHESISIYQPMFNAKKPGITNAIRDKLGFADEGLWRKFSARRLELIDALDLSSRRASDQEENVKSVAQILRSEFQYGPDTLEDFEALVRAAVQSVRRNRKRNSKTGRANKKARVEPIAKEPDSGKNSFLSEIAHIAGTQDAVYDMSYSTQTVVSNEDRSRAAIGTIIRPYKGPLSIPAIVGEDSASQADKTAERESILQSLRNTLLLHIKRSKSCLMVTMSAKNELFQVIGQGALSSVCTLMLERSFGRINKTSFEHIREKVTSTIFQAKFYRSLEPSSGASDSLDDETAANTLHTLIGCCIQDFGYDFILQYMGDAFYHCILLEYPFVASASVPFRRRAESSIPTPEFQKSLSPEQSEQSHEVEEQEKPEKNGNLEVKFEGKTEALDYKPGDMAKELDQTKSLEQTKGPDQTGEFDQEDQEKSGEITQPKQEGSALAQVERPRPKYMGGEYGSLAKLAAVASKLSPTYLPSISPELGLGSNSQDPSPTPQDSSQSETEDPAHTKVTLRFLSSALNFTFPMASSAPPRYNEILENGRQAFRLTDAQNYGLRNYKTGLTITDDLGLERLFSSRQQVDLEIYALRGSSLPLRDLAPPPAPAFLRRESTRLFPSTSFSRSHSDVSSESKIFLPPPNPNVAMNKMESSMPKFEPLL